MIQQITMHIKFGDCEGRKICLRLLNFCTHHQTECLILLFSINKLPHTNGGTLLKNIFWICEYISELHIHVYVWTNNILTVSIWRKGTLAQNFAIDHCKWNCVRTHIDYGIIGVTRVVSFIFFYFLYNEGVASPITLPRFTNARYSIWSLTRRFIVVTLSFRLRRKTLWRQHPAILLSSAVLLRNTRTTWNLLDLLVLSDPGVFLPIAPVHDGESFNYCYSLTYYLLPNFGKSVNAHFLNRSLFHEISLKFKLCPWSY